MRGTEQIEISKLALGSAQFGLAYGISNHQGVCSPSEVAEILSYADMNRIDIIDTAPLYGTSEEIIGREKRLCNHLNVVSKVDISENCSVEEQVRMSCFKSLDRLQTSCLYGLLVHHVRDLLGSSGHILYSALRKLKAKGHVKNIGVSVYNVEDLERLSSLPFLKDEDTPKSTEWSALSALDIVQLPISILDQRLLFNRSLAKLKRLNIEIHARSAFTQGLIFLDPDRLSQFFDPIVPSLKKFHSICDANGLKPVEAALSFLYQCPMLDRIICGVHNLAQLRELVRISRSVAPDFDPSAVWIPECHIAQEYYLNPANWPKS